jgi:Tfp pilus assembly protein PilV
MAKLFKQKNKFNNGFTLIEALVAISIFTLSILASMAILTNSVSNTGYAKKKLTASYLAQEGIEYIRNMRDTYVLYSSSADIGWNNFNIKIAGNTYPSGSTVCASVDGCYFNADNLAFYSNPMPMIQVPLNTCSNVTCSTNPLLFDSTTGKYGYTGANLGFSRLIKVTQINASETKISSTVYWAQGSGTQNVTFSENLFNWVEQ